MKFLDIINFIKNNQAYFEDYITRSTYHSNGIEGSTLSYAETYAILFNDNSFKISAEPREFYEAVNHKYALSYVLDHIEEDLSQSFIKHIAYLINKNIEEIDGYRRTQVFIRGAEHIPPAANMINQQMMYLIHGYHNTIYDSIFEKIANFHIRFEQTHPFPDGNGRTGRLLINYELLKNNLAPVVIPKEERATYFNLLATSDAVGLSKYFEKLSQQEQVRIEQFCEKPSLANKIAEKKEQSQEMRSTAPRQTREER